MFCSIRVQPGDTNSFRSGEEAWFWAMAVLLARHDRCGTAWRPTAEHRPCDPEDVFACLDRLYRARKLDLLHVRVLRIWGQRQVAPGDPYPHQPRDWRLWQQAMAELEWSLRERGIVG